MTGNHLNILIIGSTPVERHGYRKMLEAHAKNPIAVIEALDAAQGEAALRSTPVDCVILDFSLPDTDVLDFLSGISACSISGCTPVVFLNGQGSEIAAVQAIKHGAADCLDKHALTGELLVKTIRLAMDQRAVQQALMEHNAFLNTLLETIPNPIFYKDRQGSYLGCNKAFESFVGIPREEIIGKTRLDIVRAKADEGYFSVETDLMKGAGPHSREASLCDGNGEMRDVIVSKAAFADAGGDIKGVVGVLVDITDRKQMEAELRKAGGELKENVAKLEAANRRIVDQQKAVIEEERLKVLLQMAGATAHELNQPLAALMGYIDLFAFDKDDPDKVASYLEKIKEASYRIAQIVKKIQNIRPELVKVQNGGSNVIRFEQDIHLLAVEDNDEDFDRIADALAHQKRIHLVRARDFDDALEALAHRSFDLILLDYLLPSGNGLDFLGKLEKWDLNTPVIFSTGHGDEMVAAKAIQAGAYDYLPKAKINRENLLRMVAHTLEKHRLKNEVRQAMQKMADMSVRDELTGLYNRRYMNELLDREFSRATRYDSDLSCLLIDMDFFKQINDSYGHIFGDFVLSTFAALLKDQVRESDFCFRYGGEEFLVLLPNTSIEGANHTAEKLRAFVESHAFSDETVTTHITISIGSVSLKKHRPLDVRSMLAFADKALYRAKSEGRNRLNVYLDKSRASPATEGVDVDVAYFKERLAAILEKTRRASLNSLGLLLDQLGADKYKEHNRKALVQIDLLAYKMGLPGATIETIKRAARLHDYLKVLMPQSLMNKKEPLDSQDRACIENHSSMLADMARSFEFFRNETEILLYHQERFDGTGYPAGLKGDRIPLGARIYAVADAVAAMMFERPYRKPLDGKQIIEELTRNAGSQFDPTLVQLFLETLEDNPDLPLPAADSPK